MKFDSKIYKEDIASISKLNCDFSFLKNKNILITGATGLIGTYLVDMFLYLNEFYKLNLNLILISRKKIESNFPNVKYICHDINEPFDDAKLAGTKFDYIIHAASNTHPLQYATEPIETITTNFFGTKYLLDLATQSAGCRFLFLSSVEIYGDDTSENLSGLKESAFGYLDCNTLRAAYCEAKRVSESLCQAYIAQKNADCVIARLARCYGPTLKKDDSKALSQFLQKALKGEDITLKSSGEQYFSYLYAADAAMAVIFLMLKGVKGNAYNVSDAKSNIKLKDLAKLVAEIADTKVVFELAGEKEKQGFSKSQKAVLDCTKLNTLGFVAQTDIKTGVKKTLEVMRIHSEIPN